MNEQTNESSGKSGGTPVGVDTRVRVYPNTDAEDRGIVVEDFGETAGYAVDVGGNRIADAARRWAVKLDSGALLFVDSDNLVPE